MKSSKKIQKRKWDDWKIGVIECERKIKKLSGCKESGFENIFMILLKREEKRAKNRK